MLIIICLNDKLIGFLQVIKEQASDAVCKQMHDSSMNKSQVSLNRVFHISGVF